MCTGVELNSPEDGASARSELVWLTCRERQWGSLWGDVSSSVCRSNNIKEAGSKECGGICTEGRSAFAARPHVASLQGLMSHRWMSLDGWSMLQCRSYTVGPLLHLNTRWQMRLQVCASAHVFKTFNQSGGWTSWLGFWHGSTSSCKDKGEQVVLGSVIWLSDWSVGGITWSLRWQARIQKINK